MNMIMSHKSYELGCLINSVFASDLGGPENTVHKNRIVIGQRAI